MSRNTSILDLRCASLGKCGPDRANTFFPDTPIPNNCIFVVPGGGVYRYTVRFCACCGPIDSHACPPFRCSTPSGAVYKQLCSLTFPCTTARFHRGSRRRGLTPFFCFLTLLLQCVPCRSLVLTRFSSCFAVTSAKLHIFHFEPHGDSHSRIRC